MKILAVVVLYKQNLYNTNVYRTLLKSRNNTLVKLLVYDNSPKPQTDTIDKNIIYIWNDGQNIGLSECYNRAAKFAEENKIKWLLLLDQDTSFPNNAWDEYFRGITQHPKYYIYAPIHKTQLGKFLSPKNLISGISNKSPKTGICKFSNAYPINSGLFLSLELFKKVGGYNPKVRVDFSDIQFISKVNSILKEFYILNITCIQDFSNDTTDINKLFNRFILFCEGGRNYQYKNKYEKLLIFFLILKHTIKLSLTNKTLIFIIYYIKHYLIKKI